MPVGVKGVSPTTVNCFGTAVGRSTFNCASNATPAEIAAPLKVQLVMTPELGIAIGSGLDGVEFERFVRDAAVADRGRC
jgi:hypothetical protein